MNVLVVLLCAFLSRPSNTVLAAPPLAPPASANVHDGSLNAMLPFDVSSLLNGSIRDPGYVALLIRMKVTAPNNTYRKVSDPWDMTITTDWGDFTMRWFSYGDLIDSTKASRCVGKAQSDAVQHAIGPDRSTAMRNNPDFNYYNDGVRLFMKLSGTDHFLFWRQWAIILGQFAQYGEKNSWRAAQFYLFRGRRVTPAAYVAFGFLRQS